MSLGLNSRNITCVWAICDAVVKSGKYDGTSVNWYSVDTNDYNISIKVLGNIIRFKEVPSRVVYEYFVSKLQHSYCLQVRDGHNNFDFTTKLISFV